ncbi:hypothetical protein ATCC90586_004296 [Pythium insidiosum]|nr:hypothetical protein ATCC90586_004296 [Pythium insidiosum]
MTPPEPPPIQWAPHGATDRRSLLKRDHERSASSPFTHDVTPREEAAAPTVHSALPPKPLELRRKATALIDCDRQRHKPHKQELLAVVVFAASQRPLVHPTCSDKALPLLPPRAHHESDSFRAGRLESHTLRVATLPRDPPRSEDSLLHDAPNRLDTTALGALLIVEREPSSAPKATNGAASAVRFGELGVRAALSLMPRPRHEPRERPASGSQGVVRVGHSQSGSIVGPRHPALEVEAMHRQGPALRATRRVPLRHDGESPCSQVLATRSTLHAPPKTRDASCLQQRRVPDREEPSAHKLLFDSPHLLLRSRALPHEAPPTVDTVVQVGCELSSSRQLHEGEQSSPPPHRLPPTIKTSASQQCVLPLPEDGDAKAEPPATGLALTPVPICEAQTPAIALSPCEELEPPAPDSALPQLAHQR